MTLQLLLDSADPADWQTWLPSGLFRGITTNPTLLRRAGQPCTPSHLQDLTRRAFDLGAQQVHLQTWGSDTTTAIAIGRQLAAIDRQRVLVKVPIDRQGLDTARQLLGEGIAITFTACYEAHQVLLAAALGAQYIAPYLGRISDGGRDGHAELIAMQRALEGVGSSTRLLVASLRQPSDLSRLAAVGIGTFTVGPAIAEALFQVEATREAADRFAQDALG